MIFAPLPGEYVASAIRRGNETLGIKGINKNDYYIKKKPIKRGSEIGRKKATGKHHEIGKIKYPTLLEENGVTEDVLYENTLYPLFAAFGRTQSNCIYTPTRSWRICLHCVIEDLQIYGTAYIHRRNLLPSVSVCSIHASKLYERCPTCLKSMTSHSISKLSNCSKQFPETPKTINSHRHLYSKFVSDLLYYKEKPFAPYHIEFNLHAKLEILGYLCPTENDRKINSEIRNKLGLQAGFSYIKKPNLDDCAAIAFFSYQKADEYLKSVNDYSACQALLQEVSDINRLKFESSYKQKILV